MCFIESNHSAPDRLALKAGRFFPLLLASLIFQLLIFPSCVFAQTEVEGEVSGVWDVDGSPYMIVDSVSVLQGQRLVIESGVEVVFLQRQSMAVYGELICEGSEEDSVHLRQPVGLIRTCLYFEDQSSDNSLIAFTRLDSIRISIDGCSPTFRNNHFFESDIYTDNADATVISNNLFSAPNIIWASINVDGTNGIIIEHNVLNDSLNILISGSANVTVADNSLPGGAFELRQVRDVRLSDNFCGRLIFDTLINVEIINCNVTRVFHVSHTTGFSVRRGHYPTLTADHVREGIIDSCEFDGTIGLMAYELTITNTVAHGITAMDWTTLLVEDCVLTNLTRIDASNDIDITFRNNIINIMRVYCPNVLVENNTINSIELRGEVGFGPDNTTIFRDNRILYNVNCFANGINSPFFYHNDIGVWNNGRPAVSLIWVSGNGVHPVFVNNTFHEQENEREGRWMFDISGGIDLFNNLILGDGHGSKGIRCFEDREINSDYNVFWGLDSITVGCQIGEHSQIIDPRVMNRRERDVHLLADSPLIDAGTNRWDRSDPDGTTPDIGCYYFSQRINHPPFIAGEFEVETDQYSDFIYDAEVVDDGENAEHWFEGLPEWLEEVDDGDGREATFRLQGQPPQDGEPSYIFVVWTRDDRDQTDSMTVSLTVNQNHLLSGEISGRLTREGSPYIVVSTLTVPEGEELVIEPGTELRFRHYNDIPADARLLVLGQLTAVGTPEDTIVFTAETEREDDRFSRDWYGIAIKSTNQDSTIIQYCKVENAMFGVECGAANNIRISSCTFIDNYYSTLIYGGSRVTVSDNYFDCSSISSYDFGLKVGHQEGWVPDSSFVVISGNNFQGPIDEDTPWNSIGLVILSNFCEVYRNTFKNLTFAIRTARAGPVIHNNIMLSCMTGVSAFNDSWPSVYNNFLCGLHVGCEFIPFSDSVGIQLANNIFLECDSVAVMFSIRDYNEGEYFDISHNLLYANGLAFYSYDLIGHPLPVEGLGEIVEVNANGDSCDTYYNIILDPLLVEPNSGDYHLTENSPCINAGLDVGLPFGGDAPDIGAFEFDLAGIADGIPSQPNQLTLFPNYPNPFNMQTKVSFLLPHRSLVNVSIYDIQGRLVDILFNQKLESGQHSLTYNAENLTSGVYLVRLNTDGGVITQAINLIK